LLLVLTISSANLHKEFASTRAFAFIKTGIVREQPAFELLVRALFEKEASYLSTPQA
jgi:hypothetical protein